MRIEVKWKGYSKKANTFKPVNFLYGDVPDMVLDVLEENIDDPRVQDVLDEFNQPAPVSVQVASQVALPPTPRKIRRKAQSTTPARPEIKGQIIQTKFDVLEWQPRFEANDNLYNKVQENRCFRFTKKDLDYLNYTEDEGLYIKAA